MRKRELSPKKISRHRTRTKRVKSTKERDDLSKLSRRILEEAKKIAQMEVQKVAMEVLSDATVIARWEKNPFYIS
jgi:hypothetical protein